MELGRAGGRFSTRKQARSSAIGAKRVGEADAVRRGRGTVRCGAPSSLSRPLPPTAAQAPPPLLQPGRGRTIFRPGNMRALGRAARKRTVSRSLIAVVGLAGFMLGLGLSLVLVA
jgi:hypothetical protein